MNCQMQAKFKYVDKLPTKKGAKQVFGLVIHHILDQLVWDGPESVDTAVERFKYLWEHPEELDPANIIEVWNRTTWGGLLNRGVDVIKKAAELREWDDSQVIGTEIPFCVPMGKHEVIGYVDLLELRRSGNGKLLLRVCDYKTSSYKPSQAKLRNLVQFTVYDYASRQREFYVGNGTEEYPGFPDGAWLFDQLEDIPRRPIWIHLWDYRELDCGERTMADYMRVYGAFEQVARAEELGLYIPDISGDTCSLCDFTEPCGVKIPSAEEIAAEANAWL